MHDEAVAFREAWRVLKLGGRAAVLDKFVPEGSSLTFGRRLLGYIVSVLGTDPNGRLCEIISSVLNLTVAHDEPSLLRGQYRILLLQKAKD